MTGPCYFPSQITVNGKKLPLFNRDEGTVEFRIHPFWRGAWFRPSDSTRYAGRHTFLHIGPPLNKRFLNSVSRIRDSVMSIGYDAKYGNINFHMAPHGNPFKRTGWSRGFKIAYDPTWIQGSWHHLAFVWDAKAPKEDWLRVFIDGKETDLRHTSIIRPERLDGEMAVRYETNVPYPVQIGATNLGENEADALIDDLRISRIARYKKNFAPPNQPLALDEDTSALFHFDGTLTGQGVDEHGKHYEIQAVSGAVNAP